MKRKPKADPVARRLMTIPGVGPVNALSFIALVDDPNRFGRAILFPVDLTPLYSCHTGKT